MVCSKGSSVSNTTRLIFVFYVRSIWCRLNFQLLYLFWIRGVKKVIQQVKMIFIFLHKTVQKIILLPPTSMKLIAVSFWHPCFECYQVSNSSIIQLYFRVDGQWQRPKTRPNVNDWYDNNTCPITNGLLPPIGREYVGQSYYKKLAVCVCVR